MKTIEIPEQLQCPICQDAFVDPISIECGHTLCKNCLSSCQKTSNERKCPICREPQLTAPWLYPKNTTIQQCVEAFKADHDIKEPDKKSQNKDDVINDICDKFTTIHQKDYDDLNDILQADGNVLNPNDNNILRNLQQNDKSQISRQEAENITKLKEKPGDLHWHACVKNPGWENRLQQDCKIYKSEMNKDCFDWITRRDRKVYVIESSLNADQTPCNEFWAAFVSQGSVQSLVSNNTAKMELIFSHRAIGILYDEEKSGQGCHQINNRMDSDMINQVQNEATEVERLLKLIEDNMDQYHKSIFSNFFTDMSKDITLSTYHILNFSLKERINVCQISDFKERMQNLNKFLKFNHKKPLYQLLNKDEIVGYNTDRYNFWILIAILIVASCQQYKIQR